MPSSVSYNGCKLEPASLFTYNKVYLRTEDEQKFGSKYVFTLNFILVADRGSPRSGLDGTVSAVGFGGFNNLFWITTGYAPTESVPLNQRLAAVERKQEAIRALFKDDGKLLEVQSAAGDQPLKANCTVTSINFTEGIWVNTCNCTITLEANSVTIAGLTPDEDDFAQYLSAASESWDVGTDENVPESDDKPRTYRISHSLQATGKRRYNETGSIISEGWEQARGWVVPRLGQNSTFLTSSGVRDLPSYYIFSNHVRTENIGKNTGAYGVTETWVISSGRALEDYTIEVTDNVESPLKTVGVNGTITGLDQRDPTTMSLVTSKYVNASGRWDTVQSDLHNRAQTYSGFTLNPIPNSKSVSINRTTGNIGYNYNFDNRPTTYISGARSERITIGYSHPGDHYASLPILGGGSFGPVLQDLNCKTQKRKTLNIGAVLEPQQSLNPTFPDISAILSAVIPTGTVVLADPPEENLSIDGSNYNYSIAWVYR